MTPAARLSCNPDEVVALVRSGDVAALDRITRCYGDRLLAVGLSACRDRDDAEDAVQDALLSAGTHLGDWRGEGSIEGWIGRMVANACHRMRRGRKNDPALHDPEADVATEGTPEDEAMRGEVAAALGRGLLVLSPEDRAMLLLVEGEGWTPAEVAERTGLAAGTVRTRLSRARAKVRQALDHQPAGRA